MRIDNLEITAIEKLEEIHTLISDTYPDKKKQINYIGKLTFKEEEQVKNDSDTQIRGFLFSNKDNTRKVQIRIDGFTFNMLNPYAEWDVFSKEAFRLWKIYDEKLKPKNVIRIALRYINKIEIPLPIEDFQEYIINMPPIPKSLPQSYNNFFMQINVPYDNNGTNVIVTETIENLTKDTLPFILDIDTYKTGDIKRDTEQLKKEFENLREIKNKTFEDCITDKTRKLFEKI